MINWINENEQGHIITIEDPIEYTHAHKNCLITQREVGVDLPSFSEGVRAALRQDPDVILIGEMRDLETIEAAVTAAETGHLVLGTLHTSGATRTIDRIIDAFPATARDQIRAQLERLVPVHKVTDLTEDGPYVERELALIKVAGQGEIRVEALRIAELFRAKVVDTTTASFIFELTGAPDKIDSFITLMRELGLVEVGRTGIVGMVRGARGT